MYYIQIEDLAANALIELLEADKNNTTVSFRQLSEYGNVVVEKLRKAQKEVYLLLSRDSTNVFISDYTNFFDINELEGTISLKSSKTLEDLRNRFRSNISFDVLMAFVSEEAVSVLRKVA